MVLYLAADLIWASKIKGVGDAAGVACRPVRTLEMLEARLGDSDVRALVLDLDVPDMAMAMIARVRGCEKEAAGRRVRVLAWGPHVEVGLLKGAREAGADEVVTRGGFDHSMGETLKRLESGK